ncbi:MAG: EamA family transporter [Hyphomicrobiaceae bacterium]|nr:EamA family transporter [Hyphomicrobiaceae bacterium]
MSALGLALVLIAAFCHATWNFLIKRLNGGPELIWLISVMSVGIYFFPVLFIFVWVKPDLGPTQWLFMLGSTLLHLAYFTFLQAGYRRGDLSLVYPTARATGPLVAALLAVAVLGESFGLQKAVGALMIVGGIFFLTGRNAKNATHPGASLGFGLAVGGIIGLYTVWDAYTVATLLVPPLIFDYATSVMRVLALSPIAYRRRQVVRTFWAGHKRDMLVVAIFMPLAYILVLTALTFTPVTFVAPLREVSVLLSVIAGSVLLGEGDLGRRLGWSGFILAGMIVLVTA